MELFQHQPVDTVMWWSLVLGVYKETGVRVGDEEANLVQFSLVTQSCLTLQTPGLCTPGFPVHHQLPELAQTHVHSIGDAIQPSHPLSSPSIFPSIRVFSNESVLRIRWPKYWSFSFSIHPSNEYLGLISFQIVWTFPKCLFILEHLHLSLSSNLQLPRQTSVFTF